MATYQELVENKRKPLEVQFNLLRLKKMSENYSKRFIAFFRAFGVKGLSEYKTFTEKEKQICQREYLKTIKNHKH